MASVVINVIKRRTTQQTTLPEEEPRPPRLLLRRKKEDKSKVKDDAPSDVKSAPTMSREEKAVRTIQRTFRGFLMRGQLKGLVEETEITNQSVIEALEIIARWHVGWSRFVLQLFVGAFMIATVYFQAFSNRPATFDVNSGLIARADFAVGSSVANVSEPPRVAYYLQQMAAEFFHVEMRDTPECQALLDSYCALDTDDVAETVVALEVALGLNCTTTLDPDYVDQANRMFGTGLVTQRRARTTKCSPKLAHLEEKAFLNRFQNETPRSCLSTSEYSTTFLRDPCEDGPGMNACMQTNNFNNTPTGGEFGYNTILQAFTFPLYTGAIPILPSPAIQCKLGRMIELEWLDYRTKEVCLSMAFFNKQEQGRLTTFKRCFVFTNGGRVNSHRVVASVPMFAEPTTAIVMTSLMIALIVLKQALEFLLLYQEHASARLTRGFGYRRSLISVSTIMGALPSVLILAECILFLVLAATVEDIQASVQDDPSNAPNELLIILGKVDTATQLWIATSTLIAIALLVMLMRTLVLLDFHPRTAIVFGTLKKAAYGLWSFLLIFILVVGVYAYVGMLLLGRSRHEFSGFALAVNTLLLVAIGEVQSVEEHIFLVAIDEEYVVVIQALYFWSYILLVTILLMNVLLSIIVGAFVEMQEKAEKSLGSKPIHSFWRSLMTSIRFWSSGFLTIMKRCCRRLRAKARTGPARSVSQKKALRTPWERLIAFPKESLPPGTSSQPIIVVRRTLERILKDEWSVELIILWCRAHTRIDKMHKYGYHLRGLDPDSDLIKGRTVYLLESILKRLGSPESFRGSVTTKSVASTAGAKVTQVSFRDEQDLGEGDESEAEDGNKVMPTTTATTTPTTVTDDVEEPMAPVPPEIVRDVDQQAEPPAKHKSGEM